MLKIRGTQDIYISRGDTRVIGVNMMMRSIDGDVDYLMTDTEYMVFKLWDKGFHRELGSIKSEVGTSIIEIGSDFTSRLKGEFAYSVDLILADGSKETIIGQSPNTAPKFVVLEA